MAIGTVIYIYIYILERDTNNCCVLPSRDCSAGYLYECQQAHPQARPQPWACSASGLVEGRLFRARPRGRRGREGVYVCTHTHGPASIVWSVTFRDAPRRSPRFAVRRTGSALRQTGP